MALDLIPGLKLASVEPGQSEPVAFGEYIAPQSFETWFVFRDDKRRKEWDLFFSVEVSELGTPKLASVSVKGNRSSNLLEVKRDGVERWQLKVVEQYRTQLLTLALRIAISTRWPTVMQRSEYTVENVATSRAITEAGLKPNQRVLDHPSTITGKMPNGEKADFVRFWDGNPNPLSEKELQDLQKIIGTKIRKKITNELLKEVARIYKEEEIRLGGKPTRAVELSLNCTSYRTAQDYVRFAREAGYLPKLEEKKNGGKKQARKGKK